MLPQQSVAGYRAPYDLRWPPGVLTARPANLRIGSVDFVLSSASPLDNGIRAATGLYIRFQRGVENLWSLDGFGLGQEGQQAVDEGVLVLRGAPETLDELAQLPRC